MLADFWLALETAIDGGFFKKNIFFLLKFNQELSLCVQADV